MKPIGVSDKTLHDLEWPAVVAALQAQTSTLRGRTACESLSFAESIDEARESLAQAAEMMALIESEEEPSLAGIHDVRQWVVGAKKEIPIDPEGLVSLLETMESAHRLRRFLQTSEHTPALKKLRDRFHLVEEVTDGIDYAVDRASNRLQDWASSELGELRNRAEGLQQRVRETIQRIMHRREVAEILQDDYFTVRDDRYVLPVLSGRKNMLPGIVHGSSATGATMYIEPQELVNLNNELKVARMEVEREERRILRELAELVATHADKILRNLEALEWIDLLLAKAKLGVAWDASIPEIVEDARADLIAARHPVLLLKGARVVPNDLRIGSDFKVLVLSGANTGGKTVALKTVGLCVLLAMAGIPVPCKKGSKIGMFREVVTVMGDEQSLSDDLSTFSGNLVKLNRVLAQCGLESLVLLDEIIVGTEPTEGAALAQAILEGFADRGACAIVTTHYEPLKRMAFARNDFTNAAVGCDLKTWKPTYEVSIGLPGASAALQIAADLGTDTGVIARAREVLEGREDPDSDSLVKDLQARLEEANERNKALERQRIELEEMKARLEARIDEIEEREQEEELVRVRLRRDLLRRTENELKELVKSLQKSKDMRATNQQLQDIRQELKSTAKDESFLEEEDEDAPAEAQKDAQNAGRGTSSSLRSVRIPDLETNGILLEGPDKRGFALIEIGSIKMRLESSRYVELDGEGVEARAGVKKASLMEAIAQSKAEAKHKTKTGSAFGSHALTLDLRGETVETGLEKLESFLDRSFRDGIGQATVIHGHGTGRLKTAVRDYLPDAPFVARWRPGEKGEGGDGVTVVRIAPR